MLTRGPAIGVDGCRGGWVWIGELGDGWDGGVVSDLGQLQPRLAASGLTLIDMPIGLIDSGTEERQCDRQARALLGRPRAASVFRPPSRAALEASADGYERACAINRQRTGVALSRQTFNIMPKMREVDRLLQSHQPLRARVREGHPELCLWWLNGAQAMRFNKRTPAGRNERRRTLRRSAAALEQAVDTLLARIPRRDLAPDDATDAAALALVARSILSAGEAQSLPQPPAEDSQGLPMAILLPPS